MRGDIKIKWAFTLVELIVVITILAILGTIGFISLQNYGIYTRDSVRISDMTTIQRALEFHKLRNGSYPIPDEGNEITYSGALLFTQGILGERASGIIGVNPMPVDPNSKLPYGYSVINNGQEYQIAGVFEKQGFSLAFLGTNESYAATKRIGYVRLGGKYNGSLTFTNIAGVSYILALPSLFTADITNPEISSIFASKNILINGGINLPAHYSSLASSDTLSYTMTGAVNFGSPEYIVFSGDLETLLQEAPRLTFFKKLYSIYTSGDTAGNKYYDEITSINPQINPTKAKNYVADTIGYGVAGLYVKNFNERVIRGAIDWFNIFSFGDVGLLSNSIKTVGEGINGEMLFGSDVGVSIFKDNSWKNFTQSNTSNGLKNNSIKSIFVDPDTGDYYISHNLGVSMYDGNSWTQYDFHDLIGTYGAGNVAKDKNGNFWILTGNGLIKIEDGNMTAITSTLADSVLSGNFVINEIKDTLYIPSRSGVLVYNIDANTSTIYNYTNSDVFCETCNNYVYRLLLGNNGDIWMDKHYQEFYNMNLLSGSGTSYSGMRNGSTLGKSNRADLAKDNSGKLYLPTGENISTYDGVNWGTITPGDGMVEGKKTFTYFDKNNELWIGSKTEGISHYNGSNWISYSVNPILTTNTINDIYVESSGKVWIGTDIGIYIINIDKTWKLYNTSNLALLRSNVSNFYEYNGKLFLSHGWGMSLLNPQTMEVLNKFNQAAGSFYTDTFGELWLATYEGVKKYDSTSFNLVYSTGNGDNILSSNVYDITQDSGGNFWFATQLGVSKLEGTTWVNFPGNYPNQIEYYNDFIFVNGNTGLRKFDGTSFKTYTTADGIPSIKITDMILDDKDSLWIGTNKGIAIYLPENETFKTYDSSIGIVNDSINSIFIKGGEVWVSTAGGIAKGVLK